MANYKRLVLYMYEYDQDIKKGSLGYSRVESKNGQCKITIHITKTNWSNRKFQVYMFQRDPLAYGFICLGDIVLSGGTGELKIRTNQNDIMGSGNTLDNFSGILITDTSSTYIAGDWDEKGFAYRFIRQLENRDSMSKRDGDIELTENKNESMKQHPTIGAESVAKEKYSVERDIKIEVVTQNEIEKMDNSIDNVIPPVDEVLEVNETSTQKKEEESESINTVHTEDSNKSQTDIKILSDMVGEDIYKEEREEKTLSRDDWQEQFSKSLEAALTVAGWDNKRGAETNCTDEEEGILYRNMGYQENRNCRKPCRDILESAGFNPCAQNIMMKFPNLKTLIRSSLYLVTTMALDL